MSFSLVSSKEKNNIVFFEEFFSPKFEELNDVDDGQPVHYSLNLIERKFICESTMIKKKNSHPWFQFFTSESTFGNIVGFFMDKEFQCPEWAETRVRNKENLTKT